MKPKRKRVAELREISRVLCELINNVVDRIQYDADRNSRNTLDLLMDDAGRLVVRATRLGAFDDKRAFLEELDWTERHCPTADDRMGSLTLQWSQWLYFCEHVLLLRDEELKSEYTAARFGRDISRGARLISAEADRLESEIGTTKARPKKRGAPSRGGATTAPTNATPLLILSDIEKRTPDHVALLTGQGRFHRLNKKIGPRQLFFIQLLFNSTRSRQVGAEEMTVITIDQAMEEFSRWVESGYLKFGGNDTPAHRIQKMWQQFVVQMEPALPSLFTDKQKDDDDGKLYALRLRPTEKQNLITSIPTILYKTDT